MPPQRRCGLRTSVFHRRVNSLRSTAAGFAGSRPVVRLCDRPYRVAWASFTSGDGRTLTRYLFVLQPEAGCSRPGARLPTQDSGFDGFGDARRNGATKPFQPARSLGALRAHCPTQEPCLHAFVTHFRWDFTPGTIGETGARRGRGDWVIAGVLTRRVAVSLLNTRRIRSHGGQPVPPGPARCAVRRPPLGPRPEKSGRASLLRSKLGS